MKNFSPLRKPIRHQITRLGAVSLAALALAGLGCRLQGQTSGLSDEELMRLPISRENQVATSSGGGSASGSSSGQPVADKGTRPISLKSPDAINITLLASRLLPAQHYTHHPLDDAYSSQLLDRFLDVLDAGHFYFTQADLQEFEPYRTKLDDLTKVGDATPAQEMFNRLQQRVEENTKFAEAELKNGTFDFTGDETYVLDRKKAARPRDASEQKELWRQRLRYEYLQEKLNKQSSTEIVKKLDKRYAQTQRTIHELDSDDVLELYLTTLTHVYDPHSDYFGHASNETFNIQMRLSLVGIGATLSTEDGYVKIMELSPGGPAQKSKLLKPGDRIVAVAQAGQPPVDVVDMKLDKVVEMIRGPKDTEVKLTIIPADAPDTSTRRVITIKRAEVKLEDQAAKARIIETPAANGQVQRLGYIDLPTFYADRNKGKSATKDVALLLKKLKEQKVSGVILDLRNNGGGSLEEAISLTGLFIKSGPVVQVRDLTGEANAYPDGTTYPDDNGLVAYDGPLVVMTNHGTASASEILAGALQDYKRALIVGDTSTFGKGTVQTVIDLARFFQRVQPPVELQEDPGSMKLTIQKFYRPSGKSTQLKGVEADIVLPSVTEVLEGYEKFLDSRLEYDTIASVPYTADDRVTPYLAGLKAKSSTRVASDKDFTYLKQIISEARKAVNDKTISLNEAKRQKEKDQALARNKARQAELAARKDNQRFYTITLADAAKPGLPPVQTAKQLAEANRKPARAKNADDPDSDPANGTPERDILLDETERIISDYALVMHGK